MGETTTATTTIDAATGVKTIHGYRFGHGDRHRVLLAEDAPAILVERGREVVRRTRELHYRRKMHHSALVDRADKWLLQIVANDSGESAEALMCAKAHYRSALRKFGDHRDVLVVDGHAISRWEDGDAIDCFPLDRKAPCPLCRGCGRGRVAVGAGTRVCPTCEGSGVDPMSEFLPKCVQDHLEAEAAKRFEF